MKIHEVEQGTPAWLELRKGKMTASHATAIGNCGAGLKTYINELMSEYYSSGEREYYTNKDMDRGNELEPLAAEMYEMENGVRAEKIGFVEYNEFAGCSPDRLINDDGLLEIKCPDDKNYFKFLLEGEKAIYKILIKAMYGYESTTQLNTRQISDAWENLLQILMAAFGTEIDVKFPSEEQTTAYLESLKQ